MTLGSSRGNILWPNIIDKTSASEAAKQGWYASLFSAGATLIAVVTKTSAYSSLVDVAIMCFIGFGCLKMSRTASILGLAYTIFNAAYKYAVHSTLGIMPIFILFFINAVRGSFAFHSIREKIF